MEFLGADETIGNFTVYGGEGVKANWHTTSLRSTGLKSPVRVNVGMESTIQQDS